MEREKVVVGGRYLFVVPVDRLIVAGEVLEISPSGYAFKVRTKTPIGEYRQIWIGLYDKNLGNSEITADKFIIEELPDESGLTRQVKYLDVYIKDGEFQGVKGNKVQFLKERTDYTTHEDGSISIRITDKDIRRFGATHEISE
jgi:hypothetical protein